MWLLRKPDPATIQKFLLAQSNQDFTYAAVGATATELPAGFNVDRSRTRLGDGEQVFRAAQQALQQWAQFRLGWVEAWSPEPVIRIGTIVAVLAHVLGFWTLNACRVMYVVDEGGLVSRFGYAYGTLPGHVESGEELFLLERDHDGVVWYNILAFPVLVTCWHDLAIRWPAISRIASGGTRPLRCFAQWSRPVCSTQPTESRELLDRGACRRGQVLIR